MEIIAEVILQVLGWILQFIGEILLQAIFEFIAELIGRSVKEPFRRPQPIHPWLAAFGYLIFGSIAGALSLWVLPALFITSPSLRVVNLFVTPLVAGSLMAYAGVLRRRRGQETTRLDTFFYGYCFATAMAVVRRTWGV